MTKYLSGPAFAGLNPQRRRFVELVVDQGLVPTVAYRECGFESEHAPQGSSRLMKDPAIIAAIEERRARHEQMFDVTRRRVVDGIMEAADMAKIMSEPMVMVAAWREVGRLCGYYAPTKHVIDVNVHGEVTVKQIQQMTDEELMRMAAYEPPAIDGEYSEVEPGEGEGGAGAPRAGAAEAPVLHEADAA